MLFSYTGLFWFDLFLKRKIFEENSVTEEKYQNKQECFSTSQPNRNTARNERTKPNQTNWLDYDYRYNSCEFFEINYLWIVLSDDQPWNFLQFHITNNLLLKVNSNHKKMYSRISSCFRSISNKFWRFWFWFWLLRTPPYSAG